MDSVAKVWEGTISDVYRNLTPPSKATHWSKVAERTDGEFIVQSAQHEGMSGSAVSNGCGYLGMAHIVVTENFAAFAGIIPAKQIIDFLDSIMINYPGRLKTQTDCTKIQTRHILTFPVSPFVNCDIGDELSEYNATILL